MNKDRTYLHDTGDEGVYDPFNDLQSRQYNEGYYGSSLIGIERAEQIFKHGWSLTDHYYVNGELLQAAQFCMNPAKGTWPADWNNHFRDKIIFEKTEIERLAVAGAFIAAEIDRLIVIKNQANPLRSGKDENTKGI